jgi:hypothetical protein
MAEECVAIAKSLGYSAVISNMPPGGGATDAAPFAKAGIEAIDLNGFGAKDRDRGSVYHTPYDTSKYIEPEAVEAALKILRDYILKKDAGTISSREVNRS